MNIILKYFPNLTPKQIEQFTHLEELYRDWNSKINVISRKDFENFYLHHVLHSLAIVKSGLIVPGQTVLDVGCGGGFPVVPLAIFYPEVRFTAVDSIGKKIKVVQEVCAAAGIENVEAINCRVEALNSSYDWVMSRAVTDMATFVKWTWTKTTHGVLYLKGGDLDEEIKQASRKTEVFDISNWYTEEYFETKKLVFLRKK